MQAGTPSVILGREIMERLFPVRIPSANPVLEGRKLRVIGVPLRGHVVRRGSDDLVLMPVTFARQLMNFKALASILIRAGRWTSRR